MDIISSKVEAKETVLESVHTYYKFENGLSGLGGSRVSPSPHIPGTLSRTNKRLIFQSDALSPFPVFVEINITDIKYIKEKKDIFSLFKSIPVIVVTQRHKDREVFTGKGDTKKQEKLISFFKNVEIK